MPVPQATEHLLLHHLAEAGEPGLPTPPLRDLRVEEPVGHRSVLNVTCRLPGLEGPASAVFNGKSGFFWESRKYSTRESASGRWGKKHPFAILNQGKRPLTRPSPLTSQQHSEDGTFLPTGARSSLWRKFCVSLQESSYLPHHPWHLFKYQELRNHFYKYWVYKKPFASMKDISYNEA